MLISQPTLMLASWARGCCLGAATAFPKAMCTAILTWTVYALLVACQQISSPYAAWAIAIVGVLLYAGCVYTYVMVVVAGSGSPLDYAELKIESLEALDQQLISPPTKYVNFHISGASSSPYRYCMKCKAWKPDRCHHCSSCQRCVLRMDHHCPWYAVCIGYHNQKFFVQNLLYIAVYSGYCMAVSLLLLWGFFFHQEYETGYLLLPIVFLFVLGLVFFLTISCFSAFLCWLVLKNATTIEYMEARSWRKVDNFFDLGWRRNWRATMGPHWLYWVLPLQFTQRTLTSPVNGLNFKVDEERYAEYIRSAKLQSQLDERLGAYRDGLRGR